MDDLISREAAIAIMQAKGEMAMGTPANVFYCAAHMLEMIPAVDAVPVVRCKDCVVHGDCMTEEIFEFCGKHDGFCCVGKRKEQKHGNEY